MQSSVTDLISFLNNRKKRSRALSALFIISIPLLLIVGCSLIPPDNNQPTAAPQPNLTVELSLSASSVVKNGAITLNATVRNSGPGSSAATILTFYQSATGTALAPNPTNTRNIASLAANAASTTQTITIPSTATVGSFQYGACVRPLDTESNKSDNCAEATLTVTSSSVAGSVADLRLAKIIEPRLAIIDQGGTTAPAIKNRGEAIEAIVMIENTSDFASTKNAAITLQLQDSSSPMRFLDLPLTPPLTAPPLARRASSDQLKASFTIPFDFAVPDAMHTLRICVKLDGDPNSGNDCGDRPIRVATPPLPELAAFVRNVNGEDEATAFAAGAIALSVGVRNEGTAPTRAPTEYAAYYHQDPSRASGRIRTTDTRFSARTIRGQPLREQHPLPILRKDYTQAQTLYFTAFVPGTYYLGICVKSVFGDRDTTNNCSETKRLTIISRADNPDLSFTAFTISPQTTMSGQSISFAFTVKNTVGVAALSKQDATVVFRIRHAFHTSYPVSNLLTYTISELQLAPGAAWSPTEMDRPSVTVTKDNVPVPTGDLLTTARLISAHHNFIVEACISATSDLITGNNCTIDAVTITFPDDSGG